MLSATEGAAICRAVAPTIAWQPWATAAIVSNCVATVPAIIWRRCSGVGKAVEGLALAVGRSVGPMGVTAMPWPSTQSRKSGGTQRWTCCPSDCSCNARATSGWTSPCDPIVESSTRIRLPSWVGRSTHGQELTTGEPA